MHFCCVDPCWDDSSQVLMVWLGNEETCFSASSLLDGSSSFAVAGEGNLRPTAKTLTCAFKMTHEF